MSDDKPILEYPDGVHRHVRDALASAVRRLRATQSNRWAILSAEGQGAGPATSRFAEVRVLGDLVASDQVRLDPVLAMEGAGLQHAVPPSGEGFLLAGLSAEQAARVLHAVFMWQLGVTPFPEDGDDFGLTVEWE